MKKSMKFATALAGAAVVVVGGSAFTNSVEGMNGATVNGYGATTVTGVTLTNTEYVYDPQAKLTGINFTTSNTLPLLGDEYTITSVLGVGEPGPDITGTCTTEGGADAVIECAYAGVLTGTDIVSVNLTVTQDDFDPNPA